MKPLTCLAVCSVGEMAIYLALLEEHHRPNHLGKRYVLHLAFAGLVSVIIILVKVLPATLATVISMRSPSFP